MTYSGPRKIGPGAANNRAKGSVEIWGYSKMETEPLQVAGLSIVAFPHEHRVTATRGGKPVWNFIAGGRIGSRGQLQSDGTRLFFVSHDGYMYAVNLADGSLAWRYLLAPADQRMVAFSQVESSWPAFNVLLHEGKVFACAGRHQELDGGMHFHALDAATGRKAWHVRYQSGIG